ncbi:MAG: sulfurtransferase [Aestuariibaculum sp.]
MENDIIMEKLNIKKPVVSINWLNEHLCTDKLVVLDGTINKSFNTEQQQIPGARFFDIKNAFSNISGQFPNTFPSIEQFELAARNLGINSDSAIVVYDDKGIYSSARVWWLFKAFGYNNVAVLNGGFPKWTEVNLPTENMSLYKGEQGDFTAKIQSRYMKFFNDIKLVSINKTHIIIDARSRNRFNGRQPEPREGLRSGNIPHSVNMPFTDLLVDGKVLKPTKILKQMFSTLVKQDDAIIFSCGSGITACVLALGAELVGYKNIAVYDGSWTEWGSLVKA